MMKPVCSTTYLGWKGLEAVEQTDKLITEAPLDMRIVAGSDSAIAQRFAITLRTPGDDTALALGYLFAEGIVDSVDDCQVEQRHDDRVLVKLKPWIKFSERQLARGSILHSGCGLCGKTFIEAVSAIKTKRQRLKPMAFSQVWLDCFEEQISIRQSLFNQTGGCHAAAMFNPSGKLIYFAEDVGRHNAIDKVIGKALLDRKQTKGNVLWISGRAGFELVQKAVMANIAMLVAVGAPSSLGVEMAEESGLTLVAFARYGKANIYHQDLDC